MHNHTRTSDSNGAATERQKVGDKVYLTRRGRNWTASFWADGQHRRRSLRTANRKIALQRAMELEVQLGGGTYAAAPKATRIADAVKQYLDSKRAEDRKPKTLVKYTAELDGFAEHLASRGVTRLDQLRPEHFEHYQNARRGEGLKPKTIHVHAVIIKQFVRWCVDRELLAKNPLRTVRLRAPCVVPKVAPTKAQVESILGELADQAAKAQVALLAYTGLRAEELAMLRPQDVDLRGGWVHVVPKQGWTPKTHQARKIPIHPTLSEILTAYARRAEPERPWFFCAPPSPAYPAGGHTISTKKLNQRFQRLARSLGFATGRNNGGLVLHSLRHFFETEAVDAGTPQFVVDAWMGHVGHRATGRLYYGLTDGKSQEYMRRVGF